MTIENELLELRPSGAPKNARYSFTHRTGDVIDILEDVGSEHGALNDLNAAHALRTMMAVQLILRSRKHDFSSVDIGEQATAEGFFTLFFQFARVPGLRGILTAVPPQPEVRFELATLEDDLFGDDGFDDDGIEVPSDPDVLGIGTSPGALPYEGHAADFSFSGNAICTSGDVSDAVFAVYNRLQETGLFSPDVSRITSEGYSIGEKEVPANHRGMKSKNRNDVALFGTVIGRVLMEGRNEEAIINGEALDAIVIQLQEAKAAQIPLMATLKWEKKGPGL